MEGLLLWSDDSKNRFRLKTRAIVERLSRRCGADAVAAACPASDTRLVAHIRKQQSRKERRRAGSQAGSEVSGESRGRKTGWGHQGRAGGKQAVAPNRALAARLLLLARHAEPPQLTMALPNPSGALRPFRGAQQCCAHLVCVQQRITLRQAHVPPITLALFIGPRMLSLQP